MNVILHIKMKAPDVVGPIVVVLFRKTAFHNAIQKKKTKNLLNSC